MVGLLTIIGVGTGLIYFGGRSFYGALVFHNFMALFGIVSSLAEAGQLGTYQQPLVPLLATGQTLPDCTCEKCVQATRHDRVLGAVPQDTPSSPPTTITKCGGVVTSAVTTLGAAIKPVETTLVQ